MLAELLDLLSKRSDAWDRYNDAEREVNALYDANCGFREMNKAEDKQREAQKHFEHCCTQVGNFLDDGDVLDALRHHLVATLSPAVETKTEYAGFPVVEDPTVEPGTIEIRNPPPATTWAHGGENKCKHCGRSFLLHIAEDSYGRKDVCAPPKYGAVNTKTVRRKCCGCIDDEAHMCSECFCLCHTASSQV
jgi:hypothetical protein